MILRMKVLGILINVILMVAKCNSKGVSKTTKNKNPRHYDLWSRRDMRIAVVVTSGADRLQKTTEKFNGNAWVVNNGHSWTYSDWSSANQQDGFLCRSSSDCIWLDTDLECYNIQPDVTSDLWFGRDVADIVGSCRCLDNFWWDQDDLLCQRWGPTVDTERYLWWQILLIVLAVSVPVCLLLCIVVCISSYFANLRVKREEAERVQERQKEREEAMDRREQLAMDSLI